jgi:predicted ester cyclase
LTSAPADANPRSAEKTVQAYWDRIAARDESAFELIATDLRRHGAAEQGRDGLRRSAEVIRHDLGDPSLTIHHLVAASPFVTVHLTLSGTHQGSTMPLLTDIPVTRSPVTWTFMHLFRVEDGLIVEHWACRDDLGLLHQIDAWPPSTRGNSATGGPL